MNRTLATEARILEVIVTVRRERVIIASDLARIYGVTTSQLNQAVSRNLGRFPDDFCFRLTPRERDEVITNCDHLKPLKFSPALPLAFTEHGAVMAANMLNSERAVLVSVRVVRAFVSLQRLASNHADLARRIDALEATYDSRFKVVFAAIRQMLAPPKKRRKPIGFR